MRKIQLFILVISASIFISCSSDKFDMPKEIYEKYNIKTKGSGTSEIPALYINAKNSAGGVNIAFPLNGETAEPMFIKNEELQGFIEMYLAQSDVSSVLKSVNYLEFVSNHNFSLSYNDAAGNELIIPDMLKDDGSLIKTLKCRMTFDRIMIRMQESLSSHLNLPVFGELPIAYSLLYKKSADEMLIYADHASLSSYVEMFPLFKIDAQIIEMIKYIISQYKTSDDTLEIGLYLKHIKN